MDLQNIALIIASILHFQIITLRFMGKIDSYFKQAGLHFFAILVQIIIAIQG